MKLTSSAFINNANLPPLYSCDGSKVNPPLEISDVPGDTQSLAIIFDDPDAVNGTFTHWLVWNIDPQTNQIKANSLPTSAVSGTNSGGVTGYYPPCPPSGTHHYIFTIYALDIKLELGPNTHKDDLLKAMQGHTLDSAELTGLYSRTK